MVVSSDRQSKRGDKIPHKKFQVPFKSGFIEETLIRPALEGNKHMIGWNAYKLHLTMCESLLNSTELLEELKDFDLIVYDSFGPCAVLLSDLLRLPKVAISIPGSQSHRRITLFLFSIWFLCLCRTYQYISLDIQAT